MGKGKLLRNRQKRCENNGRPLQVSLIYRCRPALKAMNPVVLYGGYVLILIDVPQRVEVLLLAVVRRTASEFDQYISQVLSLCNTFFHLHRKKASMSKRQMETAECQRDLV